MTCRKPALRIPGWEASNFETGRECAPHALGPRRTPRRHTWRTSLSRAGLSCNFHTWDPWPTRGRSRQPFSSNVRKSPGSTRAVLAALSAAVRGSIASPSTRPRRTSRLRKFYETNAGSWASQAKFPSGKSAEYDCDPRVGSSPARYSCSRGAVVNWDAGKPEARRRVTARSSIALAAPSVLATPVPSEGADFKSRFGVVGLPREFHVGPKTGKDVWVRRISSETCGVNSSSEGLAITFPSVSRGKSSAPT